MVQRILTLCKMVDRRVWGFQHPLRQFATFPVDVLAKLEAKNVLACFFFFFFCCLYFIGDHRQITVHDFCGGWSND
jgi:hypothetical protein